MPESLGGQALTKSGASKNVSKYLGTSVNFSL